MSPTPLSLPYHHLPRASSLSFLFPSPPVSSSRASKTNNAAASTTQAPTLTSNTAPTGTPPKHCTAHCANTAEHHATHNTVERMCRETLNGRFLVGVATLVSLLPPLGAARARLRFIATVNAAACHHVLAAQTLCLLAREAEQLRREANKWHARARVLNVPVRSDAHYPVLRAELEDFELELDANVTLKEDGDKGDEPNDSHDNNSNSTEELQDTAASIKRAWSG
ncbi:hypothetical protein B0H14DRAFT_3425649 [Mycena olivaceomarginata]|nr:hypothetical protein B0H14DRAFT_3425649 [Mycena olivaceomarginata]